MTHTGEVGTEIAPVVEAEGQLGAVAASIDDVLRRATSIARALTGAEQGALKLWVDSDPGQARKYFSLSEKYAEFRDFRVNPQGLGLHGMAIPPGEVVRLTQDEVESHPLFQNFGNVRPEHPPMRGWLAMSVCGADGRVYGLLQLSDKRDGSDFNADDEECIRELAVLVGGTLDALRSAYAAAP